MVMPMFPVRGSMHSRYRPDRSRGHWVLLPVLAVMLFGIMAASNVLPRKDFAVRAVESTAPFPRDDIGATIKQIALKRGLKLREPLPDFWQGAFEGHGILLTYTFRGADEIVVGIQADPGMFGNGEIRKADALRDEIKKTLSLRFKNLEYSDSPRLR